MKRASIRSARAGDVDAIADLEAIAFGADAWSRGLVAEGVAANLATIAYLVAETSQQQSIGYAVVSVAGDDAELQRIAVPAASRRSGIGRALLEAALGHAVQGGATRLVLEVREDNNAARGFYGRTGFEEIARRPRYYRDGAAALILERPATMEW